MNRIKGMFYKSIPYFIAILFISNCSDKTKRTKYDKGEYYNDTIKIMTSKEDKLPETEEQWKVKLSNEEYRVLREKGTERAFSGEYNDHKKKGIYVCKGCGTELFTSDAKFDSHCGWPSFYEGIDKSKIKETIDRSHGMVRTEVTCAKCGGHLGHVFDDGPKDKTGLRYCINSVSLGFKLKQDTDSVPSKK